MGRTGSDNFGTNAFFHAVKQPAVLQVVLYHDHEIVGHPEVALQRLEHVNPAGRIKRVSYVQGDQQHDWPGLMAGCIGLLDGAKDFGHGIQG